MGHTQHIEENGDYLVDSKAVKQAWQGYKQFNEPIIKLWESLLAQGIMWALGAEPGLTTVPPLWPLVSSGYSSAFLSLGNPVLWFLWSIFMVAYGEGECSQGPVLR